MSAKKPLRDAIGKWIVADAVAEIVITFVKVTAVLFALTNSGRGAAAASLGLIHYVATAVFGIQMHIVTDPILNAALFFINKVWGGNTLSDPAQKTRGNWISFFVRLGVNIGTALLAGWAFTALIPNPGYPNPIFLSSEWIPQVVLNNVTAGATIIFTIILLMVGYHLGLFLLIFQSDGFGSALAVGATYGVFSYITSSISNAYLDYSINIAIWIASRESSGLQVWLLLMALGAMVLTVVLYWLIWDMFFSAEMMRTKKLNNILNEVNGGFHNNDIENGDDGDIMAPAKNRVHAAAYDAVKGM